MTGIAKATAEAIATRKKKAKKKVAKKQEGTICRKTKDGGQICRRTDM